MHLSHGRYVIIGGCAKAANLEVEISPPQEELIVKETPKKNTPLRQPHSVPKPSKPRVCKKL